MLARPFFLGLFVGLIVGVPIILAANFLAADNITTILFVLLVAIIVVAMVLGAFVLLRRRILAALGLKADALLADATDPAVSALFHAAGGDPAAAAQDLRRAIRSLASWYLQLAAQRWAMAILVGLFAAFGAILGSTLLARQNALLVEQNRTLTQQNATLSEQVRLALVQAQATTFLDTTRAARELVLKAWDTQGLRPLVDATAKNTDPLRLDGFLGVLIQHYAAAHRTAQLGHLPAAYREEIERDARIFFCIPSVRARLKQVEHLYSDDTRQFFNPPCDQ